MHANTALTSQNEKLTSEAAVMGKEMQLLRLDSHWPCSLVFMRMLPPTLACFPAATFLRPLPPGIATILASQMAPWEWARTRRFDPLGVSTCRITVCNNGLITHTTIPP